MIKIFTFIFSMVCIWGSGMPLKAQTYLIDSKKMLEIKQQKNAPSYKPAVDKLIQDAKKELKRKPASVMDKQMIAVSGDKHDYISMGPYWWPDPSKPDGLPYIRKDGVRNPELNNLDRTRMGNTMKAVTNLCYGYYFTDDQQYAAKAVELLHVWFIDEQTRMNPNLDYGQMIPGHNNGLGRGEGVIDVYCFVEMLDALELIKGSDAYSASFEGALKGWFTQFVDWMQTSRVGLDEKNAKNNHGMAYDVQLVRYALFTGNQKLAKSIIEEFPQNRIFKQVEPDGKQPYELARTIAFSYTLFNINHMLEISMIAKNIGIDLFNQQSEDGRSISKAIEFFIPYLGKAPQEWPYQQIKDWDKKQEDATWILRKAALFDPKYEEIGAQFRNTPASHRNHILHSL